MQARTPKPKTPCTNDTPPETSTASGHELRQPLEKQRIMAPEVLHQLHRDNISRSTRPRRPRRPRRPLTGLPINTRLGSYPNGVCKPTSRNPTNTRNRPTSRPRTRPVNLRPEQIKSATAIFEKLRVIPHLSNRTPTLRPLGDNADCDQYELEYPPHRLWELAGDPFLPRLTKDMLRCLRDDLIDTVSRLYEARIAFILDFATFSVVKKLSSRRGEAVFVPFLDTFDFDRHPADPTIPWKGLKNEQLSLVMAHFDVLEVRSSRQFMLLLPILWHRFLTKLLTSSWAIFS